VANLDPQERREMAAIVRRLSETVAEVPDGRHSAHASAAGPILELFSRA
jgi:hypothetical protein